MPRTGAVLINGPEQSRPTLSLSLAVSFFQAPKVSCTPATAAVPRHNYALLVDEVMS